jgi:acetate---CoA ligase (ADP-forming)
MTDSLSPFFKPRGVALIGASENPVKLSHGAFRNLAGSGFQGAIYPVNPKSNNILGYACVSNITAVPDPVDLAVVILPAPFIPQVIEDCGQRGIKAVIIISGGFRETGPEGVVLEQEVVSIARSYNMRLIGPNCVGTINLHSALNTTFIKGMPASGPIALISQSGAVCGAILDAVGDRGAGFSHIVSLGNEADVTETDMIEYMAQDKHTKVIAVYVESIHAGQRFVQVATKASLKKPIIILKGGRSEAGSRAVASHTGSLAGSQAAYQAAFKQSGVIEVETYAELLDASQAFARQPLPTGPRTVIITNSGGPGALASDALANNGMTMSDLSPTTQTTLQQELNPSAGTSNPVDMLGAADAPDYTLALNTSLKDENVDAAIAILVPQATVNPAGVAKAVGDSARANKKPVVASFLGNVSLSEARRILDQHGIPAFDFPESAGRVLGLMHRYQQWRSRYATPKPVETHIDITKAKKLLSEAGTTTMGEAQSRPLMKACGIATIDGGEASTADEAVHLAGNLGYPIVLKIASPDILHKSDAGGIRLNIENEELLRKAFGEMISQISQSYPNARIDGCLIERMATRGHEVIAGVRRDPNFGPLLMFGLGGVYVELIKDISIRVTPVSAEEIEDMIRQTRAGQLLSGLRGAKQADIPALVDTMLRLQALALAFPNIEEVEINPLLVLDEGQGVLALDARLIFSDSIKPEKENLQ